MTKENCDVSQAEGDVQSCWDNRRMTIERCLNGFVVTYRKKRKTDIEGRFRMAQEQRVFVVEETFLAFVKEHFKDS